MAETDLSNSSVTGTPWFALRSLFPNPLSAVELFLAVAGIILAVYYYNEAKVEPSLTCYVNPARAVLVRSGQASRLTALFNGKEVNSDITSAQIQIWNAGKAPIRKPSILKPLVISTADASPILEATIRKVSRDVTGIALNTAELTGGQVTVTWDILERDDGGVIQLTYAGPPETEFLIDGIVEGQKAPKYVYVGRSHGPTNPLFFLVSVAAAMVLAGLLTNVYHYGLRYWLGRGGPSISYTSKAWRKYLWAILVLALGYAAFVLVWLFLLRANPNAPFEF